MLDDRCEVIVSIISLLMFKFSYSILSEKTTFQKQNRSQCTRWPAWEKNVVKLHVFWRRQRGPGAVFQCSNSTKVTLPFKLPNAQLRSPRQCQKTTCGRRFFVSQWMTYLLSTSRRKQKKNRWWWQANPYQRTSFRSGGQVAFLIPEVVWSCCLRLEVDYSLVETQGGTM